MIQSFYCLRSFGCCGWAENASDLGPLRPSTSSQYYVCRVTSYDISMKFVCPNGPRRVLIASCFRPFVCPPPFYEVFGLELCHGSFCRSWERRISVRYSIGLSSILMHSSWHGFVSSEEDRPHLIRVTAGKLIALVALLLLILMYAVCRKSDQSRARCTCCHASDY